MSNNISQNFDYNNIRFTNLPLPISNFIFLLLIFF